MYVDCLDRVKNRQMLRFDSLTIWWRYCLRLTSKCIKHLPHIVFLDRVWCIYRYRKRTVLLLIADIARCAFQNIIATNHEKIMIGWNVTLTNYLFQVLLCNRWHGWTYLTSRPWPSIILYSHWKIKYDLSLQPYLQLAHKFFVY